MIKLHEIGAPYLTPTSKVISRAHNLIKIPRIKDKNKIIMLSNALEHGCLISHMYST